VLYPAPFEHETHAPGTVKRARRLRQNPTYWEAKLWGALRKLKLPIRRQAPIGRYVVDFACHSARIVIEVDGAIHANLPEVAIRDMQRQEWLEAQGYRLLRFSNNDLADRLPTIVEKIELAVRQAKGLETNSHV
jgi:very-short-patch-repair endonuclease